LLSLLARPALPPAVTPRLGAASPIQPLPGQDSGRGRLGSRSAAVAQRSRTARPRTDHSLRAQHGREPMRPAGRPDRGYGSQAGLGRGGPVALRNGLPVRLRAQLAEAHGLPRDQIDDTIWALSRAGPPVIDPLCELVCPIAVIPKMILVPGNGSGGAIISRDDLRPIVRQP
jgi:hypothetical protein